MSRLLSTLIVAAERAMAHSVAARDAQQLAWLVLCDRGWPTAITSVDINVEMVSAWTRAWSEYLALPMPLVSARDLVTRRRIQRSLQRCETALRNELPSQVWEIVGPLDDTGRSTLSYVLQALTVWLDARAHGEVSAAQKKSAKTCLALLAHQARELGLAPPVAPLDVDGWRRVATAANALSVRLIGTSAA